MADDATCDGCGRTFKNAAGLSAHLRADKNRCRPGMRPQKGGQRKGALIRDRQPPSWARDGWEVGQSTTSALCLVVVDPATEELTTTGDLIVGDLAHTLDVTACAAKHGLARSTVLTWLREGARHAALENERGPGQLTHHQELLADFSREVDRAMAAAQIAEDGLHGEMARGGRTRRKRRTVTKMEHEVITEITTTEEEEELLPDTRALEWRLERRSSRYLTPRKVELTGDEGQPVQVEHRVGVLAAQFRERFGLPPATDTGD